MKNQRPSKPKWLALAFLMLNVFLAFIILGAFTWEQPIYAMFGDAIGTMVEQAVIWAGVFLAAPLGLVDIIVGSMARQKKRSIDMGKVNPMIGIIIGVLGILTGLFWLVVFSFD